jgi:hydrogenase-4 component B
VDIFKITIFLIIIGGLIPFTISKRFSLMKMLSVIFISSGCLIGLIDSIYKLNNNDVYYLTYKLSDIFIITLSIDNLAKFFMIVIYLISFFSVIYSFQYLNDSSKAFRTAVSYFFYALLIVSMVFVVSANNIITFIFAWEVMSITSYFLVIYNYEDSKTIKAGYIYLVFTHIGAMFIYSAFGIMFAYTNNLDFTNLSSMPSNIKILIFMLASIGFASKAGVFPLHIWLPYAHPAAPSHISALMSGVMIKMGIYGILKMYNLLELNSCIAGYTLLALGAVSGVLGVVYALCQSELKKLLAYSSVENIGIIFTGIGIGMLGQYEKNLPMTLFGFTGAILHILNHSIFKSLLFFGAGLVIHNSKNKSIAQMGGLLKNMKITGFTFLVGSLAIAGLPVFNGFISEIIIYFGSFQGLKQSGVMQIASIVAVISLAVIGGLSLACFTRVIGVAFLGESRSTHPKTTSENGILMLFPMIMLAAICFIIGVFPEYFINLALTGTKSLIHIPVDLQLKDYFGFSTKITNACILFILVVSIIFFLNYLFYKDKKIVKSPTWGCGFSKPTSRMQYTDFSYASSIINFYKPFVSFKCDYNKVDKIFPNKTEYHLEYLDIAEKYIIQNIVKFLDLFFEKLRWIQHGNIHIYIGYILIVVIILLLQV